MPGRAAKPTAYGDGTRTPPLAAVVPLTQRRRQRPKTTVPTQATPDQQSAAYWQRVLEAAGLEDFDSHTTPAEMMPIIAAALENLTGGLLYLRYGGGPADLVPDPEAGIDYAGARELTGLLRDMTAAPTIHRDVAGGGE